jgi:hypothetical protein
MSYKENLLKKIEIDRLSRTVAKAIGPVDSGKRIDRAVLNQLMTFFPWTPKRERDLDLFLEADGPGKTRILVLDNDLTIYNTMVEDVVLRKSPTVKEMISIRNAIKILNDKDVVVSKKSASLQTIQEICIDRLDLHFTESDIVGLAEEGAASFEKGDTQGVQESLILFAELLELAPAPAVFSLNHHDIYGKLSERPGGEITFGPLVMFSMVHDTLTFQETPLSSRDKGRFDKLKAVASGEAEAVASGAGVFDLMKNKVMATTP